MPEMRIAPCIEGCPVGIDIPKFVEEIVNGKHDEAIRTIKDKNNLPAVCGRVCPQESQCEKYCILGNKWKPLAIGRLERFAADHETNGVKPDGSSAGGKESRDHRLGTGRADGGGGPGEDGLQGHGVRVTA